MIGIDIKNKIRITGLPLNIMKDIMKDLTYENPDYLKRKRGGRSTWGCPSKIVDYEKEGNVLIIPRGFSEKLKKHIKGLEINFTDSRTEGMSVDWGPMKEGWVTREYQQEAIDKCIGKSGLLKMPAGCVDADTEFFNGDGWKKISEYIEGDKVLQFNDDWKADLVEPDAYIKKECKTMSHLKTIYGVDMMLSDEHDLVFVRNEIGGPGHLTKKTKYKGHSQDFGIYKLYKEKMNTIKEIHFKNKEGFNGKFITVFNTDGGEKIKYSNNELRLRIAIMADASIRPKAKDNIRMNIKKERKKERLEMLLKKCEIKFRKEQYNPKDPGFNNYLFNYPEAHKKFPKEWMYLDKETKEVIIDELTYWDGSIGKGNRMHSFSTTNKQDADIVQFIAHSIGIRCSIWIDNRVGQNQQSANGKTYIRKSICYELKFTKRIYIGIGNQSKLENKNKCIKEVSTIDGFKYCFSVPSGMLVLRRNNKIFITGNSGKTFTGLSIAAQTKKCTVWLTHKRELLTQTKKDAKDMFPDIGKIGIIGGGKNEFGDGKLIIASIKTLFLHPEIIEKLDQVAGLIITDETHLATAKQFKHVVSSFSTKHKLGLSATLTRPDGLSFLLYNLKGDILYELPDEEIRGKEILIPEVRFIRTEFEFTQASVNIENSIDAGGEATYHDLLKTLKEDKDRKKLIVKTVLDNCKGVCSMVYSQFVEYGESLDFLIHEEAKKRGIKIRTAIIHGALGKKIREERMNQLKEKKIDIVLASSIFKEGINIKHLTHCHLTTPMRGDTNNQTPDGISLEQTTGRICRQDKDNPNKVPIIFDYCDLDNGIFKNQYYSRRRTYKRLNYKLGKVPKSKKDALNDILNKF